MNLYNVRVERELLDIRYIIRPCRRGGVTVE